MFCTQCGAPNNEGDHYCARCGHALNRPAEGPPASQGKTVAGDAAAGALYAGFWRRVGAYLIDYLVLTAAALVVAFAFGVVLAFAGSTDEVVDGFAMLLAFFGSWLYYAVLQSGPRRATLGKQAVGIQVTDLKGRRISFGRATGRYFASWLSSLTLGIGYVMAAFTARRQTLHDMIAGTVVVHKGSQEAAAGMLPVDPRPVSGWAVALIVLAAMVPMIGILAAIAIPAYQDYTIRSQVYEGLTLAAEPQAAVADAWARGADWNDIDTKYLGLTTGSGSKYVKSLEVYSGAIEIVYGKAANPHIEERTLVLVPALDEQDNLVWLCGYEQPAAGVRPLFESHWDFTDVEPKYLPAKCRPGTGGTESF